MNRAAMLLGCSQRCLHRVGDLYDTLIAVIGHPDYLSERDFHPESYPFQASWDEWGRGYVDGGRAQPAGACNGHFA